MFTKVLGFCSCTAISYLTLISCLGTISVDAAAINASPAKIQLNIHLDQQLDQNQTEAEPDLSLQQTETKPPSAANSSHTSNPHHQNFSAIKIFKERLRRQEGGQEVGENVGSIISGVLGGGLENIFQGSSSFIGNEAAAEEVNFVLHNVAPPLETVFKFGFQGLKQYFGLGQTTVRTVAATQAPEQKIFLQPVVYENGTVQYIPIYITVTKPPVLATATNPPTVPPTLEEIELIEFEDKIDDIDDKYPFLENSRVDRLH